MAKSSKSKTKIKVPKRVAGVKIPKAMRKGPVLQFVNSSAGRLLMAEALTAAVGVIAYNHSGATREQLKFGTRDAEEALKRNTARLTDAFAAGVRAFRAALADSSATAAEVDSSSDADLAGQEPPGAKKNSRRSSPPQNAL